MLIPNAPKMADLSDGLENLPEATYNYRVHKAEYVATPKTANAKGPYIKVQHIVTGPPTFVINDAEQENPYLGRLVFMNYSLTGDGSFRLKELLAVTNHDSDFELSDSDQLLGLEFAGATTIQKGTGGYSDKNQIAKHLALV